MGRTDRHRLTSRSMAKTIVGMLIGVAIAEGRIHSVGDPSGRLRAGAGRHGVRADRLRALLQMASGVRFSEEYTGTDDVARLAANMYHRGPRRHQAP